MTYTRVTPEDLNGPLFLVEGRIDRLSWRLIDAEGGKLIERGYSNPQQLRSWGDAISSIEHAALALAVREASIVDARAEPWLLSRPRVFS